MKTARSILLSLVLASVPWTILHAQTGEDNPTGVTGQFNGNVTTGGSYDPYTGNATRSITDIVVPGAAYPLAFSRTVNSRYGSGHVPGQGAYEFGKAGGWRHSYQWGISQSTLTNTFDETARPSSYNVFYPDGRAVAFAHRNGSSDPYYESIIPGVRERFIPLDPNDPENSCYLLLPDGGRVKFHAEINPTGGGGNSSTVGNNANPTPTPPPGFQFDYSLVNITDPYGLATIISGASDTNGDFRVLRIVEPAGRVLDLGYDTMSGLLVTVTERSAVGAAANRTVNYNYTTDTFSDRDFTASFYALASVDYSGEPTLQANYTYQAANNGNTTVFAPLLATCDDSMYGGAMSRIAYDSSRTELMVICSMKRMSTARLFLASAAREARALRPAATPSHAPLPTPLVIYKVGQISRLGAKQRKCPRDTTEVSSAR